MFKFLFVLITLAGTFMHATAEPYDCSQLPNPIAPHDCCQFPEFFQPAALKVCHEHSPHLNSACFYDCIFTATEICRKGKCDYRKSDDYTDWIFNASNPFVPIYKTAFRKCINKANDVRSNLVAARQKRQDCDPLPEMIYLCVLNEMFTNCPKQFWKDDVSNCSDKRSFIENCLRND